MKIGDLVKVVKLIDMHIFRGDVQGEKRFRAFQHKTGRIIGFDNLECGATPQDPMIRVQFRGKKVDAFWTEELELV
jgi:hypothetical protein